MKDENNWIPCSERLPEESGNYLVSTKHETLHVLEFSIRHRAFNASDEYDISEYAIYPIEGVLAWMPLPEPYKESENYLHRV